MPSSPHRQAILAAQAGHWDEAHRIVQALEDPLGCWIHAILHKIEGDTANARYWYARAPGHHHADFEDPVRELAEALTHC